MYINAGVMGVCLAALNVALGIGARVFIGFNNQVEKKYLRDTFPEVIFQDKLNFFSNIHNIELLCSERCQAPKPTFRKSLYLTDSLDNY